MTARTLAQLEVEVVEGWIAFNAEHSEDREGYKAMCDVEVAISRAPIASPADMAVKLRRVFDQLDDANLLPWNKANLRSVLEAAQRWGDHGLIDGKAA